MDIAGIDVGFSVKRTTGIALLSGSSLRLYRADITWKDRKRLLPKSFVPSLIAIDGPLLPAGSDPRTDRECERTFSKGLFSHRCKPGLSHFGRGYLLREASVDVFQQFGGHFFGDQAFLGDNVVEAFPNLFLGVMTREKEYQEMPETTKSKFDWLYDRVAPRLKTLRPYIPIQAGIFRLMEQETDHELRAALVCLLTAALAEAGTAFRCGDTRGGWFWLPPMDVWEEWAANELSRIQRGFFPREMFVSRR